MVDYHEEFQKSSRGFTPEDLLKFSYRTRQTKGLVEGGFFSVKEAKGLTKFEDMDLSEMTRYGIHMAERDAFNSPSRRIPEEFEGYELEFGVHTTGIAQANASRIMLEAVRKSPNYKPITQEQFNQIVAMAHQAESFLMKVLGNSSTKQL